MAKISFDENTTYFKLNAIKEPPQKPRLYLGMSSLGDACMRKLWYGFRWASARTITRRTMRIFERGDIEEQRVIRDLKAIGVECFRRDGDLKIEITGAVGEKQEEFVGFAGHAKGHPDGRCLGVPEAPKTEHLLEIKTMNDANFKKLKKLGIKASKPVYYSQAQRYMAKGNLTRTLHITTNKNDEDYHIERIHFDKDHADDLARKETDIILSDSPPTRVFARTWFECKVCSHFAVCHDGAAPRVTCRSCRNVELEVDGIWRCGLTQEVLTGEKQMAACSSYTRGW